MPSGPHALTGASWCAAQVQVAWSGDGTAVFAFRGTSKQQDAWQDLKLLRRGIPFLEDLYPGVKAHVGALTKTPDPDALLVLSWSWMLRRFVALAQVRDSCTQSLP